MDEKPLPPNWEKRIDARTGWPYFVDHSNQQTQWEDPRLQKAVTTQDSTDGNINIPINVQEGLKSNQARATISSQCDNSNLSMNGSIQQTPNALKNPPKQGVSSALNTISSIKEDAESFHAQIESFTTVKASQEYKYLEEMMERNLCKLDTIDAAGDEKIRTERREVVRYIQQCLDQLELKAFANETNVTSKDS
ncbi:BAG family molecular chaperone regulator 4-like [Watersipora subatra]|uniref:BAG family molecular chaperone regulator 4-like n=1 Tax=Watersipora subatra TaxID=2589382 RepID=UPI00355AE21B